MRAPRGGTIPPALLQRRLTHITETLAAALARSGQPMPDWTQFDWTLARAVAAMHGVSPLLSRALRWPAPGAWLDFTEQQRVHTRRRHARIDELLRCIDRRARDSGIAILALKGAALHAIGVYSPGDRPMADIDLLVRPRDSQRTAALIASLGYAEYGASWKERAFSPIGAHRVGPLGEDSGNDVKIELHERICEMLPRSVTDISQVIFPSRARSGLNPYPGKAALMLHLLLHAAGAMAFQSLRLLHLHDLASLARLMRPADWDAILEYRARARSLWWALPPLGVMRRYYAEAFPARVLAAFECDCPWLLERWSRRRTLSDVSYSHLRVDAFPGIAWSQSLAELLAYALSRIRPDAHWQAQRESASKNEAWASESQWANLSQHRRILRWLTSRQSRPVTMHAVRAALAQCQ